ncbi:hypothetical protein QFZ97_008382 [Paraburkholderia youngii]
MSAASLSMPQSIQFLDLAANGGLAHPQAPSAAAQAAGTGNFVERKQMSEIHCQQPANIAVADSRSEIR